MSLNGWNEVKLEDIIQFNPRGNMVKKQLAKKLRWKNSNRSVEQLRVMNMQSLRAGQSSETGIRYLLV